MLKDITAYVGQSECYQCSSELLKKTMQLNLGAIQFVALGCYFT